jgi:DNA repair protein RAD50
MPPCTSLQLPLHRYVRDRRSRKLKESVDHLETIEGEIQQLTSAVEKARESIAEINREISEGAAMVANLRENLRVRKLQTMIEAAQEEMDKYDLDAAARAKESFEKKYSGDKQKETDLHAKVCKTPFFYADH